MSYGVGVTHTCILLANYLSKQRGKISLIEFNKTNHFQNIEKGYEGLHYKPEQTNNFNIKGVTYYKQVSKNQLIELLSQSKDYIILDMGNECGESFNEFLRADIQLVVAHSNDWKIDELYNFYYKNKERLVKEIIWCIPFATKEDIKDIKKIVKGKVVPIPYHNDPYVKNKNITNAISKII